LASDVKTRWTIAPILFAVRRMIPDRVVIPRIVG
jgi:hypothetical protein